MYKYLKPLCCAIQLRLQQNDTVICCSDNCFGYLTLVFLFHVLFSGQNYPLVSRLISTIFGLIKDASLFPFSSSEPGTVLLGKLSLCGFRYLLSVKFCSANELRFSGIVKKVVITLIFEACNYNYDLI
jgi:hypothetical protein